VRYIAAFVAALRWVRDPAHRAEAVGLLKEKFKLTDAVAERTYDRSSTPHSASTATPASIPRASATC
jgi:hypothetical protein